MKTYISVVLACILLVILAHAPTTDAVKIITAAACLMITIATMVISPTNTYEKLGVFVISGGYPPTGMSVKVLAPAEIDQYIVKAESLEEARHLVYRLFVGIEKNENDWRFTDQCREIFTEIHTDGHYFPTAFEGWFNVDQFSSRQAEEEWVI